MKPLPAPLLSALVLFILTRISAQATDRVVVPGGMPPVYPTIAAALNAASDNDRILVTPATYTGTITIAKSVELTSTVSGQRYTVTGDLVIAPGPGHKRIAVHGLVLSGMIGGATDPNPHSFTLTGSTTGRIDVQGLYRTRCTLLRDTVNGSVRMRGGDLIGCRITGGDDHPGADHFGVLLMWGEEGNTATCNVIGNHMGSIAELADANGSLPVSITAASPVYFANNYVELFGAAYLNRPIACYTPDFDQIERFRFVNNTVRWVNVGSELQDLIWADGQTVYAPIDARNNLLIGPLRIAVSGNTSSQGFNLQTMDSGQINISTGRPIPASIAWDSGDPDASFTDLDLSRNDVGCYGGSMSRDQFDDPVMNLAQATWTDAQHRVITLTPTAVVTQAVDR
ncbi:MAG: hypothetical protein JST41_08845 [Bacteroidetes bacterium]|nr:hypothetical protein [Bacteroidota bacterium]MBX7128973.1 hypothetical protein [Flavobacteriales bacterium]MCC6655491.1 hypothetical protein [Flavobacteriales bacterium]HMU12676.1 hypothetical protein [Flavobacteriales bacterium]HNA32352.1 hypothetical protein [Flavobacteriales bacterium]